MAARKVFENLKVLEHEPINHYRPSPTIARSRAMRPRPRSFAPGHRAATDPAASRPRALDAELAELKGVHAELAEENQTPQNNGSYLNDAFPGVFRNLRFFEHAFSQSFKNLQFFEHFSLPPL